MKIKQLIMAICVTIFLILYSYCLAQSVEDIDIIRERFNELENVASGNDDNAFTIYTYDSAIEIPNISITDPIGKQFLIDMSSALNNRWMLSEKDPYNADYEVLRSARNKMVESELKILEKYRNTEFEDKLLGLIAYTYIVALDNQLIANENYLNVDESLYQKYWFDNGYNFRAVIIYMLNRYYQLSIDAKYQDTYSDMLVEGYLLIPENAIDYLLSINKANDDTTKETESDMETQQDSSLAETSSALLSDDNVDAIYSDIKESGFTFRRGVLIGDSKEDVINKETLELTLSEDGNALTSDLTTIASIENSKVTYDFENNELVSMTYNLRSDMLNTETNVAALMIADDYNTIEKALNQLYNDPIEESSKYTKVRTGIKQDLDEILASIKLIEYMQNKGKISNESDCTGTERVVYVDGGIIKIDHYVYSMYNVPLHFICYEFFSDNKIEEIMNDNVDNSVIDDL